jgi:KDO2-lipid IV(A) lauroyltransferase
MLKTRWALYRVAEGVFFVLYGLSRMLPVSLFRAAALPALWVFIKIVIPRHRVSKNLRTALGNTHSPRTIRLLTRGVQCHFVQNLLDCFIQIGDSDYARRAIVVKGEEHLETALKKGSGVIALGAHIGNFVLLGTRLGMEGYPLHTLFRIPADRRIRQAIMEYLPRYHQYVIPSTPRRTAVKNILAALKRNEIVHILSDNLKRGRVDTQLFGYPVSAPRGPISLALRSGALVVPMYVVRHGRGGMQLVIEPEIPMIRNGNLSTDIAENTRRVVVHLESLIRRYPDQWNWLTVRMSKHGTKQIDTRI